VGRVGIYALRHRLHEVIEALPAHGTSKGTAPPIAALHWLRRGTGGIPRRRRSEALLRVAAFIIECELPLTREHADAISNLTGESIEIESYAEAGHAVRRWLVIMDEDAPRN
jgi:hypothetical protein